MKRTLLVTACGLALCANAGTASAAGTYVGLLGGGSWAGGALYDEPFHTDPPDPGFGFHPLPLSQGFAGSAALGLLFGAGMRAEAEFTYRSHGIQTSSFEGTVAGNARIFGAMANFWFDVHPMGDFTPYIGGGVGVANVHFNFTNTDDAPQSNVNGSSTVFAYQLGAGVAIAAGNHVTITLDYRFLGTGSVNVPTNDPGFGVKGPLHTHTIMTGLRIDLGAP